MTEPKPLRVLIADDEPLAAERLQLLLARIDSAQLVGTASDGESAINLATALKPDLLLLDEPTNYLDLEGTLWLIAYLATYPATVLIISHDRDLLDAVCDHILHLDGGKLTLSRGNYESFETQRREQQLIQQKVEASRLAVRADLAVALGGGLAAPEDSPTPNVLEPATVPVRKP